jgi:hypothetical protein
MEFNIRKTAFFSAAAAPKQKQADSGLVFVNARGHRFHIRPKAMLNLYAKRPGARHDTGSYSEFITGWGSTIMP